MQKEHRDSIQRNFSSLVEQTDLDMMVSALYEKGVFSDAMIEPYKDTNKDTRSRKRQMYRDITRRGPDAFQNLLDALSENGYWDLVRDLDPNSSLHTRNRSTPVQTGDSSFLSIKKNKTGRDQNDVNRNRPMPSTSGYRNPPENRPAESHNENNGNITPALENAAAASLDASQGQVPIPQFNVIKSTKFFEDDGSDFKLYRTRGRSRGVLILLSYVAYRDRIERYRRGAEVDAVNLKYLFSELGFKVLYYADLSLKETRETLAGLRGALRAGPRPETVFMVVSSHGYMRAGAGAGTGDYDLRCADGGLISFYQIIEYFNNVKFPELLGVPKVFIFQSCRGTEDFPPTHMSVPAGAGAGAGAAAAADGAGAPAASGPARPAGPARPGGPDAPDARADRPRPRDHGAGDADADACSRMYSDILIAHSTLPGYVSMRDPERGSWFIGALCDVFAARAHDTHVQDLFTLVDELLRRRHGAQTSSVDRWGFNRRLYLHPGLCED